MQNKYHIYEIIGARSNHRMTAVVMEQQKRQAERGWMKVITAVESSMQMQAE